jgi:hypothetical protein
MRYLIVIPLLLFAFAGQRAHAQFGPLTPSQSITLSTGSVSATSTATTTINGVTTTTTVTSSAKQGPTLQPFVITRKVDVSSPILPLQ